MPKQNVPLARFSLTLTLLLVAAVPTLGQTARGKPGPPPPPLPPPPGTIYYWMQDTFWKMKADGSGKTPVAPAASIPGFYQPSSLVYGNGDRWYLSTERPDPSVGWEDIYAYRVVGGQIQKVRVTSFNTQMFAYRWTLQWSNDGEDSFISFKAQDIREYWDNGENEDLLKDGIYRIHVSGAQIQAAADDEPGNPVVEMPFDMSAVEHVVSAYTYHELFGWYTWSPDGNRIAYSYKPTVETQYASLLLHNLTTAQTTPILAREPSGFSWSPSRDELLTNDFRVYNLSGGLLRTVLIGDKSNGYSQPRWSPDGNHLVFRHDKIKGGVSNAFAIARIPATGGTIVQLTNDLNASLVKTVKGWVSDNDAGP